MVAPGVVEKEDDMVLRDRDLRIEESRGGFVLLARTTPLDRDAISTSSGSHRRMVLDKHGKPSIRKTIVSVRCARNQRCFDHYFIVTVIDIWTIILITNLKCCY